MTVTISPRTTLWIDSAKYSSSDLNAQPFEKVVETDINSPGHVILAPIAFIRTVHIYTGRDGLCENGPEPIVGTEPSKRRSVSRGLDADLSITAHIADLG